jgi:hypothetical protein
MATGFLEGKNNLGLRQFPASDGIARTVGKSPYRIPLITFSGPTRLDGTYMIQIQQTYHAPKFCWF